MPRQMPTTLRPRIRAQARGGSPLHHVPNRRPRFPTSTPPPGSSTHPSGISIRSQQDSISFNPAAFMAPVRTSVATEFNSGEHRRLAWYHKAGLLSMQKINRQDSVATLFHTPGYTNSVLQGIRCSHNFPHNFLMIPFMSVKGLRQRRKYENRRRRPKSG